MRNYIKANLFIIFICLTGCQSVWQQPIPDNEIIYQGEGVDNSYVFAHKLGFVNASGGNTQKLEINRQFEKPVWSADGQFLYGLSGAHGNYMGYPAYWDLQKGHYGICKRNLPYFGQIQGSGNPENPYEVIVQNIWTIVVIDISHCKQIRTLVDYSDRPGDFSVQGFSYSPTRQALLYGLVVHHDGGTKYRLMHLDLQTSAQEQLAEGINPSWSPDGTLVAFIGLDGLYVLALDGIEPELKRLVDQPFFDPWSSGSPWEDATVPSWSPDGAWLVYHRCNAVKSCTWEDATIYKIPSDGGQEETILQGGEYPSWRP